MSATPHHAGSTAIARSGGLSWDELSGEPLCCFLLALPHRPTTCRVNRRVSYESLKWALLEQTSARRPGTLLPPPQKYIMHHGTCHCNQGSGVQGRTSTRYGTPCRGGRWSRRKPGFSVEYTYVTCFSHRTLVGRQDARTLLYNIKSTVEATRGDTDSVRVSQQDHTGHTTAQSSRDTDPGFGLHILMLYISLVSRSRESRQSIDSVFNIGLRRDTVQRSVSPLHHEPC